MKKSKTVGRRQMFGLAPAFLIPGMAMAAGKIPNETKDAAKAKTAAVQLETTGLRFPRFA